ncbi:MAG: hypothetical protein ACP5UO_04005 [Thermoplasmata archaeon]
MYSKHMTYVAVALVLVSVIAVGMLFPASVLGSGGPAPPTVSSPNPANLVFTFTVTSSWGAAYHVGDNYSAKVTNFPAYQQVNIYLGPDRIGTLQTNATGYGILNSTIPAIAGGSYYPTAVVPSQNLYASSTQITISPFFEVTDPAGQMLNVSASSYEFVPNNASLTVKAFGLTPGTAYSITDQLAAPSGILGADLITSINVGSLSTSGIYSAANGTLILTYKAYYKSQATSTISTISMGAVSGYKGQTFAYKTIGPAVISTPSSFSITSPGANQSLAVSGLIPSGSRVYPGVSYYYSAYIGSSLISLTFSKITSTRLNTSSGSLTGYFTIPSGLGLYYLNITYYGSSFSSSIGSSYIVISTAGTSPSSGNLVVVSTSTGYEAVGYGYTGTPAPTLYYTTYSGTHSQSVSMSNGAFASSFSPGSEPAGTYSVFTEVTSSSVNYFVYSSYTVSIAIQLSTNSGYVGSSFTLTTTGLLPSTYYTVYLGSVNLTKTSPLQTDSTGKISSAQLTVPVVSAGNYTLSVDLYGTSTTSVSTVFQVILNKNIVLSTASPYAFPGQLVQFSVSGITSGSNPISGTIVGSPSYSVTVSLNGTALATVPAQFSSGTLTGSFKMPNGNPDSYYMITFSANETALVSYAGASSSTVYTTITFPMTGTQSGFIELVSGNGAYILGISQSQIAQIDSSINATLSVPLSQLDAAVSNINGNVATITTEFGTMASTLKAMNATIVSIQAGVALLNSSFGQFRTSLKALNATVTEFKGDVAIINTTVGQEQVSLSAINATVNIINGKTAKIDTAIGTFTGNVTSVANGIATIQTSLGKIQANTEQSVPPTGTNFLIEIITLVLVLIAVVISLLAFVSIRDLRSRFGIKKE